MDWKIPIGPETGRIACHDPVFPPAMTLPGNNAHIQEQRPLCVDLFILRHGKAQPADCTTHDADRALTGKGRDEITSVAQWMVSRGYDFDVIATSPLKRARQTAEIIASFQGAKHRVVVWESLAIAGDLDAICRNLGEYEKSGKVLIVGHEPTLSMLISRIITGTDTAAIVMAKGGLAKIRNYSSLYRPSGELQWLLSPRQMIISE